MRLAAFPAVLAIYLALPAGAHACNLINNANQGLQSRLDLQGEIQDKMEDALKKENARCLSVQSSISSRTAQAAGAQSCIALQESAAFNRELKQKSRECAEKVDGIRIAMEFVRDTQFKPFRSSIDLVVQADQNDSFLQRICGGQLSDTASVLERTEALLSRSKKGIAKANADFDTYAALTAKVAGFEASTQNGYDRCVAEGKILKSAPVSSSSPVPVEVPQGQSQPDASDITGTDRDAAKRAREKEILGF